MPRNEKMTIQELQKYIETLHIKHTAKVLCVLYHLVDKTGKAPYKLYKLIKDEILSTGKSNGTKTTSGTKRNTSRSMGSN